MTDVVWDCVVVGGGVMGCCSAWQLAKTGTNTIILEQFTLPHTRGSSHGKSRIIRKMYHKDLYASMMNEAYDMWDDIERQSGKELFRKTGLVLLESKTGSEIQETINAMKRQNLPYEKLSNSELRKRYPQLNYPSDYEALLDMDAGLLIPDSCLTAIQQLFVNNGGTIHDGRKVEKLIPGNIVTIVTNRGNYRARKVVLHPGPWAQDLLQSTGLSLPLKTFPTVVGYYKCSGRIYDWHVCPVLVEEKKCQSQIQYSLIYLIPIAEYQGHVKSMPGLSSFWKEKTRGFSIDERFPIVLDQIRAVEGYRFFALFPSWEYPGYLKAMPGCQWYWKSPPDLIGYPILLHPSQSQADDVVNYRTFYAFPPNEYPALMKTMPGFQWYWKSSSHYFDCPIVRHPSQSLADDVVNYRTYYAFPPNEYPGHMKIVTRGEPPPRYCHPDARDIESNQPIIDMVAEYIRKHLPGIEDKPSIMEPCVYTMTPDRDWIIDFIPRCKNIIIGAGFSGHGFKLAPVVGKLISEMVQGKKPSYDMHIWRICRFKSSKL